jgi:hypothetical protein
MKFRTLAPTLAVACAIGVAAPAAFAQFQGLDARVFSPSVDYGFGQVIDLLPADLTGDGINDVAFVLDNGYIGFWIGRTDGRLDDDVLISAADDGETRDFAIFDYDEDNDPDVIRTSNRDGGELRVFENQGSSNFAVDFVVTGLGNLVEKLGVSMGDIDNDGDMDVYILEQNGVRIVENIPGGFSPSFASATFANFEAISFDAGDIDGDGRDDAVVFSDANGVEEIIVLESNGANLVIVERIPFVDDPRDIELVDIDMDGDLDCVASSASQSRINVYTNTGGQLSFAYSVSTPEPREVEIADMDADGDLDLVTIGRPSSSDFVYILLNDGMGFFTQFPTTYTMTFDDFDAIGIGDITPGTGIDVFEGAHSSSGGFSIRNNLTAFDTPDAFDLLFPADAAADLALPENVSNWGGAVSAFIEWERAAGFDVTYSVTISESPSLSNPVFTGSTNERRLDVSTAGLHPGVTYFWSVTAINPQGATAAANGPFSFTTAAGGVPACPDLTGDGLVNGQDLVQLLGSFGDVCAP